MSKNYTPEFEKKVVRFRRKKRESIKVSQSSMEYRKPVYPSGTANSAKNSRRTHKYAKVMALCKRNFG